MTISVIGSLNLHFMHMHTNTQSHSRTAARPHSLVARAPAYSHAANPSLPLPKHSEREGMGGGRWSPFMVPINNVPCFGHGSPVDSHQHITWKNFAMTGPKWFHSSNQNAIAMWRGPVQWWWEFDQVGWWSIGIRLGFRRAGQSIILQAYTYTRHTKHAPCRQVRGRPRVHANYE